MKNTGIVRKVDELGRVVVPKELRRQLGIGDNDPVEIYMDEDKIILKKYQPCCHFCASEEELVDFKGKKICTLCLAELGVKQ